jgi:sigma-B regulation protein RsbU (phosphoserine phosphatase)
MDDYPYEAYRREFLAGDFVTIFTDGFSEAMNAQRELFGLERLVQLCADKGTKPKDLGPCILESVHKFVGDTPQSDDMCLLCFGRE